MRPTSYRPFRRSRHRSPMAHGTRRSAADLSANLDHLICTRQVANGHLVPRAVGPLFASRTLGWLRTLVARPRSCARRASLPCELCARALPVLAVALLLMVVLAP